MGTRRLPPGFRRGSGMSNLRQGADTRKSLISPILGTQMTLMSQIATDRTVSGDYRQVTKAITICENQLFSVSSVFYHMPYGNTDDTDATDVHRLLQGLGLGMWTLRDYTADNIVHLTSKTRVLSVPSPPGRATCGRADSASQNPARWAGSKERETPDLLLKEKRR